MPTIGDWQELCANTTGGWVASYNGVSGYLFRSKTAPTKELFLPASGLFDDDSQQYAGLYGYCWLSSLRTDGPDGAYRAQFDSSSIQTDKFGNRFFGFPVRPVRLP